MNKKGPANKIQKMGWDKKPQRTKMSKSLDIIGIFKKVAIT